MGIGRGWMGDTSWDTGRNRDFLWEFHAVSIYGDTPIAGWFISWKILLNWMILGVTPHFRKPPYGFITCSNQDSDI